MVLTEFEEDVEKIELVNLCSFHTKGIPSWYDCSVLDNKSEVSSSIPGGTV